MIGKRPQRVNKRKYKAEVARGFVEIGVIGIANNATTMATETRVFASPKSKENSIIDPIVNKKVAKFFMKVVKCEGFLIINTPKKTFTI